MAQDARMYLRDMRETHEGLVKNIKTVNEQLQKVMADNDIDPYKTDIAKLSPKVRARLSMLTRMLTKNEELEEQVWNTLKEAEKELKEDEDYLKQNGIKFNFAVE